MGGDFHVIAAVLYSGLDEATRTKSCVVTIDPYILKAVHFAHVDLPGLTTRGNDVVR